MALDACCCPVVEECSPCPPGTIYPWLVDVTFPSLGVTVQAGNQLDPEEDGEEVFLYRVEGDYPDEDGRILGFQCQFEECHAAISIFYDGGCICNGIFAAAIMTALSCPPSEAGLVLVYDVPCYDDGCDASSIQVVITTG